MKSASVVLAGLLSFHVLGYAQTAGAVRGTVQDPSGAVITGATVEIQNPVSHYDRTVKSDSQGSFQFENIPYNNYHLTVTAGGFQTGSQDIDVRTPLPMDLKIGLRLGSATTTVTVEAGQDLIETEPTTHTDIDRGLFERLPQQNCSGHPNRS